MYFTICLQFIETIVELTMEVNTDLPFYHDVITKSVPCNNPYSGGDLYHRIDMVIGMMYMCERCDEQGDLLSSVSLVSYAKRKCSLSAQKCV